MAEQVVRIEGAHALEGGLKQAKRDIDRALAGAHRQVGREVRDWARSDAASGTAQQRRMAGGIGSRASRSDARLTVKNTAGAPGAQGAFYGSKQYRQFPPWVGNDWPVASTSAGPQPINKTLAEREDEIADRILTESWKAIDKAVPTKPRGR